MQPRDLSFPESSLKSFSNFSQILPNCSELQSCKEFCPEVPLLPQPIPAAFCRKRIAMNLIFVHSPVRRIPVILATGLLALLALPALHADTVVLKNGDRLTGTAVKLDGRSEEHTSELQSRENLVCRLL